MIFSGGNVVPSEWKYHLKSETVKASHLRTEIFSWWLSFSPLRLWERDTSSNGVVVCMCVEDMRTENMLMSAGVTAPESMLMKCHAQAGNQ